MKEVENIEFEINRLEGEAGDKSVLKGRAESIISACREDLDKIARWRESLDSLNKVIGDKRDRIESHHLIDTFLKEAPVLELENLAPTIMNDANELLREFYDSSWSFLIKTLTARKSGDGYKEDFKIVIYKDDNARDFDFLSGGQQIMVESVLRQAIKLVNQSRKSDVGIAFCDESDGLLNVCADVISAKLANGKRYTDGVRMG